jgi:hypothetical protein
MLCTHIHDFVRGTKTVLPRPAVRKPSRDSEWDIVRPNQRAEQLACRHRLALEAINADERRQVTEY